MDECEKHCRPIFGYLMLAVLNEPNEAFQGQSSNGVLELEYILHVRTWDVGIRVNPRVRLVGMFGWPKFPYPSLAHDASDRCSTTVAAILPLLRCSLSYPGEGGTCARGGP
jgi:hypothetical protein